MPKISVYLAHFVANFSPLWGPFPVSGFLRPIGIFFVTVSLLSCNYFRSDSDSYGEKEGLSFTSFVRSPLAGKVLDVREWETANGATIQLFSNADQDNQKWMITSKGQGIFYITAKHSDKCLDILQFKNENGAEVGQWSCHEKSNQEWIIGRKNTAYEIKSRWNYRCLTIKDGRVDNGAPIVMDTCFANSHQLWTFGPGFDAWFDRIQNRETVQENKHEFSPIREVANEAVYPIIGIQTFDPGYKFSKDDALSETVKRAFEMGSKIIKLNASDSKGLETALSLPFTHYFLWFRSGYHWRDGFDEKEEAEEYQQTFAFAKKILNDPRLSGKKVFLGHWEGDWFLVPEGKADLEASDTAIQGMIEWLNIRQKAIDEAKKSSPQSQVDIYHYAEVNRVRDAMIENKKRMVTHVLPYVDVDYVSYSAYDVQQEGQKTINDTLNFIQSKLRKASGSQKKRVFIGEFGIWLEQAGSEQNQVKMNKEFVRKFVNWGSPFMIYWSMYNTAKNKNLGRSFGLINEKNIKTEFYHSLQELYKALDAANQEQASPQQEFESWRILDVLSRWLQ